MLIRGLKDSDNVKDLIISCIDDDFTPYGREVFIKSLKDFKGISFVCEINGEIVGFVNGDGNRMNHFFVKEGYRGFGIGKKLFEKIKEELFKDDLTFDIKLYSSTYALPIYKKWGFKETGKRKIVSGCWGTPMVYKKSS